MQKFIDIALPTLTSAQAAEIHQQLRETLEDVMALMDDALLPPDYHSAFLDKTNELLCALARNIAADASSRRA